MRNINYEDELKNLEEKRNKEIENLTKKYDEDKARLELMKKRQDDESVNLADVLDGLSMKLRSGEITPAGIYEELNAFRRNSDGVANHMNLIMSTALESPEKSELLDLASKSVRTEVTVHSENGSEPVAHAVFIDKDGNRTEKEFSAQMLPRDYMMAKMRDAFKEIRIPGFFF